VPNPATRWEITGIVYFASQLGSILTFVRQNWFKIFSRQGAKAQSLGIKQMTTTDPTLASLRLCENIFLSEFGVASRQAR
jgi:hypothetical protein